MSDDAPETPRFDDDRSSSWIEQFTGAGRVVILASIGVGVSVGIGLFDYLGENATVEWPLAIVLIAGGGAFGITLFMLRLLLASWKIPFHVKPPE